MCAMKAMTFAGLALLGLVGAIEPARAVGCGDTLFVGTTLLTDLDCRGRPFALKLGRSNITLNLGGRTITSGTEGVIAEGVSNVAIMGPGRIQGGQRAIRVTGVAQLFVSGIDVVVGGPDGIVLIDSSNATITSNRFDGLNGAGVSVMQRPTSPTAAAGGHAISGNAFANAGYGVRFCGSNAGGNAVLSNTFINIGTAAVMTTQGAGNNRVQINDFASLSLLRLESNDNLVSGNRFGPGARGIVIMTHPGSTCFWRDPGPMVKNNSLQNNNFNGVSQPLVIGSGVVGYRAERNHANGNIIDGATVGLTFKVDSAFNEGSANVYAATATPVIDLGVGNTW